MKIKEIIDTPLPGAKLIKFERFHDHRGSFSEIWGSELNELLNVQFAQMNEAFCVARSIRGLHFQWQPYMGKLIRSIDGTVYDYIVDIRIDSPTLGKAYIVELSEDHEWFWVPPGFAHAVYTLGDARIQYFCSGKYNKDYEGGIYPFSQDIDYSLCDAGLFKTLEIVKKNPVISDKDRVANELDVWLKNEKSKNFIYGKL